eukprot:352554-Chlamydomonas_euryale.AAC.2
MLFRMSGDTCPPTPPLFPHLKQREALEPLDAWHAVGRHVNDVEPRKCGQPLEARDAVVTEAAHALQAVALHADFAEAAQRREAGKAGDAVAAEPQVLCGCGSVACGGIGGVDLGGGGGG